MKNRLAALVLATLAIVACAAPAPAEESAGTADALSGDFAVGTPLRVTASVGQRSEPSPSAPVLQTIPGGADVQAASAHSRAGWFGVTWNGKTGWVDGQFLQKSTTEGYTRQQVYQLALPRKQAGSGAASDLLDPSLTTQALVNAVGWLATHTTIDWGFSVINTGHHDDPLAHTGGFAIDLFANNAADDDAFIDLVNRNPYIAEIGVSGDYAGYVDRFTNGKCAFIENAPTHVHVGVKRAFC